MTVRMSSMCNDSELISVTGGGGGGSVSQSNSNMNSSGSSPTSQNPIQAFNWFFDKSELKRTPSFFDGITFERERRYRNEGTRFILQCGSAMKLRYDTLATGVVYFHRFYMFHSFNVFPRYVTAACCLFLAGKAEETPKKCKDIIKIAKSIISEEHYRSFGEDAKEEVLTMERIVLQTIRFDLQVEHPYKYLVMYTKNFKGDKALIQQVLQMAWTFTNDSLSTTLSLQWEPEIVAIAMIFLSCKIKYEIPDWNGRLPSHKHWWDVYVDDLSVEMLEDICHQVLDLYSNSHMKEMKDATNATSNSMQNQAPQLTPIVAQSNSAVVPPPPRPPPSAPAPPVLSSTAPTLYPPPLPPPPPTVPMPTGVTGTQYRFPGAPPPPPATLPSNNTQMMNNVSLVPPTIPPQWDQNMASFYHPNYNMGLVQLTNPPGSNPGVHMSSQVIPPGIPACPPPPPPPVISQLHGLAHLGRLPPPPPQPPLPPPTIAPFVPSGTLQNQR